MKNYCNAIVRLFFRYGFVIVNKRKRDHFVMVHIVKLAKSLNRILKINKIYYNALRWHTALCLIVNRNLIIDKVMYPKKVIDFVFISSYSTRLQFGLLIYQSFFFYSSRGGSVINLADSWWFMIQLFEKCFYMSTWLEIDKFFSEIRLAWIYSYRALFYITETLWTISGTMKSIFFNC